MATIELAIDIESFSSVDIKNGAYAYSQSPDFEILLVGYKFSDDEDVTVIDMLNEDPGAHKRFWDSLEDPCVIKTAYNANFEVTCLSRHIGRQLPESQWRCTMILASQLGLPRSLADVGEALGLAKEDQKLKTGAALIQYFCKPCKPTKANGYRVRNMPEHSPERWKLFKEYNAQDVHTEQTILDLLRKFRPDAKEQKLWTLDQEINDRGVLLDVDMAEKVVRYSTKRTDELMREAQIRTGLDNPNSLQQLKTWLAGQDIKVDTLTKGDVSELLSDKLPDNVRRVLEIRQSLGKTSLNKYQTMLDVACDDGRARGIMQFYGGHTGRWAGRSLQPQNLTRNTMPDDMLDAARAFVKADDFEALELVFDDPSDVLSQLVRTAFIPSPGNRFVVTDFSAIEARVVAWAANETWRLDVFRNGGDIYCESASRIYHKPVVKHGINGELRQKGKVAELACIAKGQRVLTDRGLVPIENVTTSMKVWDGVEWVSHDGVVSRGFKEVLTYDGLTATADHRVYVKGHRRPVYFGIAATCGAHLAKAGDGRRSIRLGEDHQPGEALVGELEPLLCVNGVYGLRSHYMDRTLQPYTRKIERLSVVFTAAAVPEVARQTVHFGEAALHESARRELQKLRSEGHQILLFIRDGGLPLHGRNERTAGALHGDRPHRRQRQLRAWKPQMGDAPAELPKSAQICEVYDIVNAGPRHRFTVENVLVHNCAYGGGVGAMKAMDPSGAVPEEEMDGIIRQWRAESPKIVKFWGAVQDAAIMVINGEAAVKRLTNFRNITFRLARIADTKVLRIYLPNGRPISYWDPKVLDGEKGPRVTYMSQNQTTRKWERTDTWGGKLVENIIQSIARDCLAEKMTQLEGMGYPIVFHVHDEMILDIPRSDKAAAEIVDRVMAEPLDWAPELPLKGGTYECDFYRKD